MAIIWEYNPIIWQSFGNTAKKCIYSKITFAVGQYKIIQKMLLLHFLFKKIWSCHEKALPLHPLSKSTVVGAFDFLLFLESGVVSKLP